ncbi:hypothetical protein WA026_023221 [Henosepilachna vigintioctopunctata]|uniref:Homeobox domain-containing protein n=1 Tax=Henosepilachna vigintioctopunctata TaxID=420089 RepID=A0AAW1VJN9_9CUCU
MDRTLLGMPNVRKIEKNQRKPKFTTQSIREDQRIFRCETCHKSYKHSSSLRNHKLFNCGRTQGTKVFRKRRTRFSGQAKVFLEGTFKTNPNPTAEQRRTIGEIIGLDQQVVRDWFKNRKRKDRRQKYSWIS